MPLGPPRKKLPKKKVKRTPISNYIRTISICSVCKEIVCVTDAGNAYRHGFDRHRKSRGISKHRRGHKASSWVQEDGQACAGSGKQVKYKKAKDQNS